MQGVHERSQYHWLRFSPIAWGKTLLRTQIQTFDSMLCRLHELQRLRRLKYYAQDFRVDLGHNGKLIERAQRWFHPYVSALSVRRLLESMIVNQLKDELHYDLFPMFDNRDHKFLKIMVPRGDHGNPNWLP